MKAKTLSLACLLATSPVFARDFIPPTATAPSAETHLQRLETG